MTARKRSPSLPDVPTVEEAGLPGYETVQWLGRRARRHPRPIIERLHAEFQQGAAPPDGSRAPDQGRARGGAEESPDAYARFIRAEYDRWPAIVKAAGVTPE